MLRYQPCYEDTPTAWRRGHLHRAAPAAEAAERPSRDCALSQKTRLLHLLLSQHLVGFGVARCCAVA